MSLVFDWSSLESLTHGAGTGGVLRGQASDFQVTEIPAYTPGGEGEHLYLWLQKEGHTTAHVVRELCNQLGIRDRDIGVAGLKDRHAVTQQWLSLPAKYERRLERFALEGAQILRVERHTNKLGMGHLRGNRFTVRVREAAGQAARAEAILAELTRRGVPNYFGPQRFGLGGLNAEEGLRVMRGESRLKDPRVRRFLVSSVQSAVFNAWVSWRLQRGLFDELLLGDMAKKHDTGGVFLVENTQETLRARSGEVSATGTLFGKKTAPLTLEAGELEREVLGHFGLTPENFASRRGDRRIIRIFPQELALTPHEDGYSLTFALPKGSFATSVLREVMKVNVDSAADSGEDADMEAE